MEGQSKIHFTVH